MLLKRKEFKPCNSMGKIVSAVPRRASNDAHTQDSSSLYAASPFAAAERKYLNHAERRRVLAATDALDIRPALFALTLVWSGARISEVLALTPASFQIERSLVAFVTLKRRRWSVREVPIPPALMEMIAQEFSLTEIQDDPAASRQRLWTMSRTTAWRVVKRLMEVAGVIGRGACARGLRHSFGVGTLQAGVPITLLQRWLGHARLSTTEIYANAIGPEELSFASQFWSWSK
jgi:integrase